MEYAANARGAQNVRTQTSEIEELINRVGAVNRRLGETINSMEETANRVLGAWPDNGENVECSPMPNGLISSFNHVLDLFERDVARANDLANRLARL